MHMLRNQSRDLTGVACKHELRSAGNDGKRRAVDAPPSSAHYVEAFRRAG
jgi:hypothetical protein